MQIEKLPDSWLDFTYLNGSVNAPNSKSFSFILMTKP